MLVTLQLWKRYLTVVIVITVPKQPHPVVPVYVFFPICQVLSHPSPSTLPLIPPLPHNPSHSTQPCLHCPETHPINLLSLLYFQMIMEMPEIDALTCNHTGDACYKYGHQVINAFMEVSLTLALFFPLFFSIMFKVIYMLASFLYIH